MAAVQVCCVSTSEHVHLIVPTSLWKLPNTHNWLKRTLFNLTKQDKMREFSMKSFPNLRTVFLIFLSERRQSTQFQISVCENYQK